MNITAQLVILNSDKQILCVSRKTNHNDFGLPGGKMEKCDNNNPELTAIRETFEETGIEANILRLVFVTHKYGSMSYTYLATTKNFEIKHDEPHIVKWGSFEDIINGSFGEYNALVLNSLKDMNII